MTQCSHCEYGLIWQGDTAAACPDCLLQRLREPTDGWSGDAFAVDAATAAAAADEIERLRAALEDARSKAGREHDWANHMMAQVAALREASADALSGWRHIRRHHGDLSGVGWDRVESALKEALK